jgi:uncharacterized membrane protein YgdD (TMEM256/DUF423 family)
VKDSAKRLIGWKKIFKPKESIVIWIRIGSLLMFAAVALGAFGSHALRGKLTDHSLEIYKTAVLYHMVHAMGLFLVAWMDTQIHDIKITLAGSFMLAGIILFSGSLYLLALSGQKWLGAITPLGGLSFLLAWLFLFLVK